MPKATRSPKVLQGVYWMLTIPMDDFDPPFGTDDFTTQERWSKVRWIKGQLEEGESGYKHYQVVVAFKRSARLAQVKKIFGTTCHAELTRSDAADEYVWKEDTSLGDRFEYGKKAFNRTNPVDWEEVLEHAKVGSFELIPADIQVRHWSSLTKIRAHYDRPTYRDTTTSVYHGPTGTGKTFQAFKEAMDLDEEAYVKNPRTKFWDGYRGQKVVILDEFRYSHY